MEESISRVNNHKEFRDNHDEIDWSKGRISVKINAKNVKYSSRMLSMPEINKIADDILRPVETKLIKTKEK